MEGKRNLTSGSNLWVLLALGGLALTGPATAATYKWVDEKGVIHYTDKMPPEAINKGNIELNKQGVPIKKTDPALTTEQRRAKEAEEERLARAQRERELIERRNRALLQSYTTEGEIDLAKKRAVETIEAQVTSAQSYSTLLNKRKKEIETRKAASSDKSLPLSMEREVANIDTELEKQSELIAAKRKELAVVSARYDNDKLRWQSLRNVADASPPPPPTGAAPKGATPVVAK